MASPSYRSYSFPLPDGLPDDGFASIQAGLERLKVVLAVMRKEKQVLIEAEDFADVLPQIVEVFRSQGHPLPTTKENLPVLNMSCAACAVSVESVAKSQPGVLSAAVNYANASLWVEFLPSVTNEQVLKAVVQFRSCMQ